MRTLVSFVILFGLSVAVDMVVLDEHYGRVLWNDTKYQSDKASRVIHEQFRRLGRD
jgi:hypothetical protein